MMKQGMLSKLSLNYKYLRWNFAVLSSQIWLYKVKEVLLITFNPSCRSPVQLRMIEMIAHFGEFSFRVQDWLRLTRDEIGLQQTAMFCV
jgi:hypothetical protein